ncbi:MAG: FG-GAP-like repeat-containing protein [Desulfosalsimonadaceae bacterium]
MTLGHRLLVLSGTVFLCTGFLSACVVFSPGHADKSSGAAEYGELLEEARHLINERHHLEAIALLTEAGAVAPDRPEWLYESGRAFFATDRFERAAKACQRAIQNDPSHYDAMALDWAARLEAGGGSGKSRRKVRSEIQELVAAAEGSPNALLAAYKGYGWLDEEAARRRLVFKLAPLAASASALTRESIAAGLFEQIICAGDDRAQQNRLMHAYIQYFPERRFVERIINKLLKAEWEAAEDYQSPMAFVRSTLPEKARGSRVNAGIAVWLLEQEMMPEKAVSLLEAGIKTADTTSGEKPPFFDDALWQAELKKDRDYLHYLLGRALFHTGRPARARTELVCLAGRGRNWSGIYHYLGRIDRSRGNLDSAIGCFRRALEIDDRQEDTEKYLAELLRSKRGYAGDPARYFSRMEKSARFADVTESAGLGGCSARRVAWGDYNRDGDVDLLLDGTRLYKNNGDGTFANVSKRAGLDRILEANGGTWADYDNDGDLDIFVTSHGKNYLLENKGEGAFVDVTDRAFGGPPPESRTEAAAWGDMDNDGFLDLYVANYEGSGVMRGLGTPDRLYRNNGDGTFSEIGLSGGIRPDEAMCGRGVTWSDINADGHQDIVVANYRLDPNFLWINDNGGGFADKAGSSNVRGRMTDGAFGHSIGPASGDLDGDGDFDLVITNLAHPRYIQYSDKTMVLMNKGAHSFEFAYRFAASGIAFEETNADPALADVDNDGDLDLYMTSIYSGRNCHLYENGGNARFDDITWQSGTRIKNAWGAAFADFNNDGFPDLLTASSDGVTLLRNEGGGGHWLKVLIRDSRCNRFGVGSIIRVAYGGKEQVREVVCGRGTGSQDSTAVIFGLGGYDGPVTVTARTLCGDRLEACLARPDQTVLLRYLSHF